MVRILVRRSEGHASVSTKTYKLQYSEIRHIRRKSSSYEL